MDERERERTVTCRQLLQNPRAVYEQARGSQVILVDDNGIQRAIIAVPTDEQPDKFEL